VVAGSNPAAPTKENLTAPRQLFLPIATIIFAG
jgi:hypothetical protein